MTFRDFLRDRMGFILIYLFNLALVAAVIELDLMGTNGRSGGLTSGGLLYIGVLGIAGVTSYLVFDYVRRRSYWRRMRRLFEAEPNAEAWDNLLSIPEGVTREQRHLSEAFRKLHRSYSDLLARYRSRQEEHDFFTRQWVHQMKTPVSVIHLLTQRPAPEQGPPSAPWRESIQEEVERLQHGLDMMLHTARLDKFEVDLRVQPVDLLPLIRGVINEHKKACIRWRIYPRVTGPDKPCLVLSDEKWSRIVIHQLVSNAVKYSKSKAADSHPFTVTVSEDAAGWHAAFRDEGVGIAETDLPRVFDPFFTGENGRRVEESTGMGLYLSREVCRRLGHRIDIASVLGEGTTVTLHFSRESTLHALQDGER
ncbi:sensor histidine kinase [Paenibacillus sp. P26]|nr:sensor histidine kinase [Paenibacillus sp. P26]